MSDANETSDREEEASESLAPPAANEPQGETTATTTNTTSDRHAVLSMDTDTQNQLALDWTQLAAQAPPVRYPADVTDIDPEETELLIVGTAGQKITNMGKDLCQHVSSDLTSLVLRSHLIKHMEGLEGFSKLETLELYDNQVQELQCLGDGPNGAPGQTLLVLDISYNAIRDLQPIEACPHLRELYIANNKLKSMRGLRHLIHLKKIDLGANRLRVMDPDELRPLTQLEELWLGKNKIEKLQGLEMLTKLRRLDVQSNRLEAIEGLTSLNDTLEELYLAHNGITVEGALTPTGLQMALPKLSVLDLSRNRLTNASPFGHLKSLDELWLSGNKITSFADIECLAPLGQSLDTIYLEYNPFQSDDPLYRKKIAQLLPNLSQIDANMIQGLTAQGLDPVPTITTSTNATFETKEEAAKRLRDQAIERARQETETKKQQQGSEKATTDS